MSTNCFPDFSQIHRLRRNCLPKLIDCQNLNMAMSKWERYSGDHSFQIQARSDAPDTILGIHLYLSQML
jgi:hypothetical protein